MTLCTECPKYKTCTELCEEAEEYVSQDCASMGKGGVMIQDGYSAYASRKGPKMSLDAAANEWLDMMNFHKGVKDFPEPNFDMADVEEILDHILSPKQHRAIVGYYIDGKLMSDIAKDEGVSRQSIQQRIIWGGKALVRCLEGRKKWREKILPNAKHFTEKQIQVALLVYHEGMRVGEAAKVIGCKSNTVGRHITRIDKRIAAIEGKEYEPSKPNKHWHEGLKEAWKVKRSG